MVNWSVADPGSAQPPPPPSRLFLDQTGARTAEFFSETALPPPPPLSKGVDDRDPNLSQGLDPALLEHKLFDRPKTKGNIRPNSL